MKVEDDERVDSRKYVEVVGVGGGAAVAAAARTGRACATAVAAVHAAVWGCVS